MAIPFQLLKAREELYKPKLLINVTEEQKKEKEREKEVEREKKVRDREKEDWDREIRKSEEQQHAEEADRPRTLERQRSDHESDDKRARSEDKRVSETDDRSSKGGYNRSLSNSPAPLPNGSPRSPSPENNAYGSPPLSSHPQTSQSSSGGDRTSEYCELFSVTRCSGDY